MTDWINSFDESLWLKPDEVGEEEAHFLVQALRLQPGMRVLDLPCGAGRVAVHLARAGCRMTGIDRNPHFIARAQRRFADEGVTGEFHTRDMRDLNVAGTYDAIYNWLGSFGYFSDEENADVLRRMAHALKPGGRLLIEQPNRERVLRHFLPVNQFPTGFSENRWIPETQQVESRWHITDTGAVSVSTMRLYTPAQFRRLLASAGLEVEALYGDRDGGLYTRRCRRVSVVGRKDD